MEAATLTPAKDIDLYLHSLGEKNKEYKQRIEPILSTRAENVIAGKPIDKILSHLFDLKQKQCKIRQQISKAQKIRSAIRLSPRFIDYAVNFGMLRTEQVLRNHLIKEGSLASPIFFQET